MRTDSRLGTFEEVLDSTTPTLASIATYLRALIEELHPDVVEVPRPGEPTVAYGTGPKKMSEAYAYLGPQRASLNLGFYHGAALPDPAGLLEGTGKALRHIKLTTLEQAARPEVRALLVAARDDRQQALAIAEVKHHHPGLIDQAGERDDLGHSPNQDRENVADF